MESMVRVEDKQGDPVDREKTCPLLLRLFCTYGRHQSPYDYQRGSFPLSELQIYTWMDATLREITQLIKEVYVDASERGTYFDFQLIAPDKQSARYFARDIGSTCSNQKGPDDNKTLAQCRFTIGDYMDVCIIRPNKPNAIPRGRPTRYRD